MASTNSDAMPSTRPPSRKRAGAWGQAPRSTVAVRVPRWSGLAALLFVLGVMPAQGLREGQIVYYDPDANHQAIVRITSWFNEYLTDRRMDLTFQPVQSRRAFESLLAQPTTRFAFVASSYLEEQGISKLQPLLVPANDGSPFYQKVLLDSGQGSPGNLRGKSIAATVPTQNPQSAIRETLAVLRKGGVNVAGATGIPVSKDIDALLALSFGQVEAALVTPGSIDVLKRINPSAVTRFRTVYETDPILRSPLCRVGSRTTGSEQRRLVDALKNMKNHSAGARAMGSMGFDEWVEFEPEMMK